MKSEMRMRDPEVRFARALLRRIGFCFRILPAEESNER
jgi:hypothetical protein